MITAAQAKLPLLAGKIAATVTKERLTSSRVTTIDEVPPTADALTTEWLTAALCRNVPSAEVVDFEVVGGPTGPARVAR